MENDDLTSLAGVIEEPVTVMVGGRTIPLTAFTPADYIAAAQFLRTQREQRAIGPAGYLRNIPDNDLRAKTLAEIGAKPVTEADVLIDAEASFKMLERAAARAGFNGGWEQFVAGLSSEECRELQTKAIRLAGLGSPKPKNGDGPLPLDSMTSTVP